MRKSKNGEVKSINLALYFGLLVLLIIIISVLFKAFDLVRKSKFDSKHRFTIAVVNNNDWDIYTVLPSEGQQLNINIEGEILNDPTKAYSIPIDSYVKTKSHFSPDSKLIFLRMLINKRKIDGDINVWDLFKLSMYSLGVGSDKFDKEKIEKDEIQSLENISSEKFEDQELAKEKVDIQITNSTQIGGLGNRVASMVSNLGGAVVLVNNSKELQSESIIYFENDSYTVRKLSKILKMKTEKRKTSSIAQIVIVIGKDRGEDL